MGWMTFEKVLSQAAGRFKAPVWRPTDSQTDLTYLALSSAKLVQFPVCFHYLDTQSLQVDYRFSLFKNRYTSRNKCNGVQWGAINAMNFEKYLHFVVIYSYLWPKRLR